MSLLTKYSAEEWVYLRKYVKYGVAQRVEMNHNEDSLFMAFRMNYCYVWFIAQNVWSRFQIAGGQSSFCVWAAVQTKSTRFSSHLVLGDRRFFSRPTICPLLGGFVLFSQEKWMVLRERSKMPKCPLFSHFELLAYTFNKTFRRDVVFISKKLL